MQQVNSGICKEITIHLNSPNKYSLEVVPIKRQNGEEKWKFFSCFKSENL